VDEFRPRINSTDTFHLFNTVKLDNTLSAFSLAHVE
jgi:hypothetical protein